MAINSDNLKIQLEEMGIPSEKIDEAIIYIESEQNDKIENNREVPISDTRENLKERLAAESNWRKKASIAAQLISLNL